MIYCYEQARQRPGIDRSLRYNTTILGLQDLLLSSTSLRDLIKGSLIGLYPNSRKSIRGKFFEHKIETLIKEVLNEIKEEKKISINYESQKPIPLPKGPKNVDFLIKKDNKIIVAIETNFYSVTGSKPSEIIRSYEDLQSKLKEKNIALIVISDGIGWLKMKNLVNIAFEKLDNFLNYKQAQNILKEIILKSFNV